MEVTPQDAVTTPWALTGSRWDKEFYTQLRTPNEAGHPVLIIFSYADNNNVKIAYPGEWAFDTKWEGVIAKGGRQEHELEYSDEMAVRVISDCTP